ncbi:MAG: hypothetical protein J3K34DRAFT_404559 [Monoraphidium minutum]|nr:MAG: hypothetical protein J3K34DRAFT_404559 [Monoraphidium minutum]
MASQHAILGRRRQTHAVRGWCLGHPPTGGRLREDFKSSQSVRGGIWRGTLYARRRPRRPHAPPFTFDTRRMRPRPRLPPPPGGRLCSDTLLGPTHFLGHNSHAPAQPPNPRPGRAPQLVPRRPCEPMRASPRRRRRSLLRRSLVRTCAGEPRAVIA